METLRRISANFSRRQHDTAGAATASDSPNTNMNEPKLTVDTGTQASPNCEPAQNEDVPRSPLTGKPLSPRAQMIRDQLANELKEGPVIF